MPWMVEFWAEILRWGPIQEFGWLDEKPAHRVRVDPFWIDENEVTNAQFLAFVEEKNYVATVEKSPTVDEILSQLTPGTPAPMQKGASFNLDAVKAKKQAARAAMAK